MTLLNMDNYANDFINRDKTTDTFCVSCGDLIEDTQVFAPATEYEFETELCEDCFNEKIKNNNNFEKPL